MRHSLRLVTCLSIAFAGLHCGGGSHPAATGSSGSGTVGTSGGTVSNSDGTLQIVVPAGALPANVDVTLTPITPPGAGAIGPAYDIGPTGTQFTTPVTLTFSYASLSLSGVDPSTLRAATFAGGTWQILAGAVVDAQAKTVSGTTTHLSPYGIVVVSSGSVCAILQSNPSTCTGSPASGSSGGTAPDCPAGPTCETASNVCAGYPGATMQDCSDVAMGYTAACCFAPGAPICFAIANDVTCAGSGTSGGPAGGGTAPPQPDCPASPTCASATAACANYPGATLQNCVDGTSGYTGSCCFAPAAPVCVMVAAASGGSTCTSGPSGGSSCPPPPAPPRCADGNPCAGVVGSTMQSCTDTSDGYQAACCLPVGVLPSTGSSSSGSTGGIDAGIHTGGGSTDAGAGAPSPNDGGGGTKPPQPDAGGQPPPPSDAGGTKPPQPDAGGTKPPQPDAGGTKPPQPDAGSQPPPPSDAGGTKPPQPDAGSQPPPPSPDGGSGACMVKMMPSGGQGAPCGVSESCPNGAYQVQCDGASGQCTCMSQAGATSAPGTFSCANFDAVGALAACGFPTGS